MVKKFTIPFASQGDANDIPDALQVDGKASFTQGFGYDYERPYDDPQAKDIAREDMNGLFKAITSAVGELQTLGASEWSSAISYPKGAIIYYEKDLYISQVDDNQNKPPQNWVSITSIANDSLKKTANLSDLTDKTTARSNLGLGSSATLNKTDVLGASTNLVATQKLVNDTKINLESSKQDKLEFVGSGKVMREGAYGVGGYRLGEEGYTKVPMPKNIYNTGRQTLTAVRLMIPQEESHAPRENQLYGGIVIPRSLRPCEFGVSGIGINATFHYRGFSSPGSLVTDWHQVYSDKNTTTDKSGFLRAGGSANALTEADATPVGTIQAFVGENAPNDKWLLCRGQAFSAGSYPSLALLLPDLKIPDLRGVALRGLDANRGFDPNRALLSYQEDAMQKIAGSFTSRGAHDSSLIIDATGAFVRYSESSSSVAIQRMTQVRDQDVVKFESSRVTRTNTQNETVMKNVAVNFIIKAR